MKILVLGSGGREHAFAWKIARSPLCKELYIAPGNGGTPQNGTNIKLDTGNFPSVRTFVNEKGIDMIVVGPEDPLVRGISDFFRNDPVFVAGPSSQGARLEGSKEFAKEFMTKYSIPTATYRSFSSAQYKEAVNFLKGNEPPYVIKADGLAAGKGVIISKNLHDAENTLREMMIEKKFSAAGERIIIEKFLPGREISMFVLSDGNNYLLLPEAKDYKRIGEGDTGLNTGGMGAISPVPGTSEEFRDKVMDRIINPSMEGLRKENIFYSGFLYFGLINVSGEPYLLEYNCRMGDPETEAVIPRIENDLVEIFIAMKEKKITDIKLKVSDQAAATVVLASGGYPEEFEKNKEVTGLNSVRDSLIFHAGTVRKDGKIFTAGGRVLAITSCGNTLREAVEKSNRSAQRISFENKYCRTDIGNDVLIQ